MCRCPVAEHRPDLPSDEVPVGGARKRRRFDPGSVVTGLFFLLVAGLFLAGGVTGDSLDRPDVVIPALVVGLGLVGIIRVITRSRRHR
jgi:hypothetical protein